MLCPPTGGAVSPSEAIWGCGWCPRMGGVLKGPQIGSCGLSRVCARARVRTWACACGEIGAQRRTCVR
nr:MAG TPA: hypothetical protein [Caudoviricetes sp.]